MAGGGHLEFLIGFKKCHIHDIDLAKQVSRRISENSQNWHIGHKMWHAQIRWHTDDLQALQKLNVEDAPSISK